jgi:hypothetical protein
MDSLTRTAAFLPWPQHAGRRTGLFLGWWETSCCLLSSFGVAPTVRARPGRHCGVLRGRNWAKAPRTAAHWGPCPPRARSGKLGTRSAQTFYQALTHPQTSLDAPIWNKWFWDSRGVGFPTSNTSKGLGCIPSTFPQVLQATFYWPQKRSGFGGSLFPPPPPQADIRFGLGR